ncbi:SseB family protein [Marisediminicola sp. LYQ85]|uniref:SseB family protein n=1 Tax=Marisediminicola sp. LYQ85 TaxID=3391062 RepID=UPI00398346BF
MPDHGGQATDSAGTPWVGRQFEHNPFGGDDGSASPELVAALSAFRRGETGEDVVVDAIRAARLLAPLVATLGESGSGEHGLLVDKSAELAIVTVAGPDGRRVLPIFTSVSAMAAWNPAARPVPVSADRACLAAASDGTELMVLDPTSDTEFVVRRPALRAIAEGAAWIPSHRDADVHEAMRAAVVDVASVRGIRFASGDPVSRLAGPELAVTLELAPGLDSDALSVVLTRVSEAWSRSEIVALRVDSLAVTLAAASP